MRHSSAELFSFASTINRAADLWSQWMVAMAWQAAVLFVLLLLITWLIRHKSARLRYGLWMLFFAKLAVPPTLALATGWGWWLLPMDSSSEPQTNQLSIASSFVDFDDIEHVAVSEPEFKTAQTFDRTSSNSKSSLVVNSYQAPANNPEISSEQVSAASWLMIVWGIGVTLLMLRFVIGWILIERTRRSVDQKSEEFEALRARLSECQKRIGLRRNIAIGVGDSNIGPLLLGFLRPMIVVPTGVAKRLGDEELDAVLNHELSHVCRHDVLLKVIQTVVSAAYFFNPMVWIAGRILDRLREDACDEATLAARGVDRSAYGSGLVKIAELTSSSPPSMALGMSGSKHQVVRRLKRILNPGCPIGRKLSVASIATILTTAAILIPSAARTSVVEEPPFDSVEMNQVSEDEATDEFDVESIPEDERVVVTGVVVDSDGEPVAGTTVILTRVWNEGIRQATTDGEGNFSFTGHRKHLRIAMVQASNKNESQLGAVMLPFQLELIGAEPVEIKLSRPHTVKSMVVDPDGNPLADVTVGFVSGSFLRGTSRSDASGMAQLKLAKSISISTIFAVSDQHGFDYRMFARGRKFRGDKKQRYSLPPDEPVVLTLADPAPVTLRVIDEDGNPVPGVDIHPWLLRKSTENDSFNVGVAGFLAKELFHRKTNMKGEADFAFLPPWQDRFSFWPMAEGFVRHQRVYDRNVNDGKLTITLKKTVKISGIVKMPDGTPCTNSEVVIRGDTSGLNSFTKEVKTNENGEYEAYVDPGMLYLLVARCEDGDGKHFVSDKRDGFAVWAKKPLEGLDLDLRPAARIFGSVTNRKDGSPVGNQGIRLALRATSASDAGVDLPPDAQGNRYVVTPNYWQSSTTDANGQFEFWAGAGDYDLVPSSQNARRRFTVDGPEAKEFNFKMSRPVKGLLKGSVVDSETGKPVANAILEGAYHRSRVNSMGMNAKTDATGEYAVERSLHRMTVVVTNADKTKGTLVRVGNADKSKDIELSPLSSAKGVIIDSASGLPAAGFVVRYGVNIRYENGGFSTRFGGEATTNDKGEFEIEHLVVGAEYSLTYRTGKLQSTRITNCRPADDSQVQLGEFHMAIPE